MSDTRTLTELKIASEFSQIFLFAPPPPPPPPLRTTRQS